jgi:hypothetical protein
MGFYVYLQQGTSRTVYEAFSEYNVRPPKHYFIVQIGTYLLPKGEGPWASEAITEMSGPSNNVHRRHHGVFEAKLGCKLFLLLPNHDRKLVSSDAKDRHEGDGYRKAMPRTTRIEKA